MRIETRIDRSGPVERAYEQASGDDEHDAEGHLADDERVPQAQAADAAACRFSGPAGHRLFDASSAGASPDSNAATKERPAVKAMHAAIERER